MGWRRPAVRRARFAVIQEIGMLSIKVNIRSRIPRPATVLPCRRTELVLRRP